MPEAKLAREAEVCYATVAMVTDYDCWHPGHDAVTVDQIVQVLLGNAGRARQLVSHAAPLVGGDAHAAGCGCRSALSHALITAEQARDPAVLATLDAVAARMLGGR
jgi:5'-methylthioadenosine phosphorylase